MRSLDAPLPGGVSGLYFDTLDSTLDEARRRAADVSEPLWIVTGHQTAGRGRGGRVWKAPAGNMAAALILPVAEPVERGALRSFVAAIALRDVLSRLVPADVRIALKWPNDVLLNGGKVAGILLETLPGAKLAVGIGVNVVAAPQLEPDRDGPAPSALADVTAAPPGVETVAGHLAHAFHRWEARLATDGFAPIRASWLASAAYLGETITARTPRDTFRGVFEALDPSGHLILRTAKGLVTIAAADVYFGAV